MHRKGRKPRVPTHSHGCTALCIKGPPCSEARPQPACGPTPALHFLTERNDSRRRGRSFAQAVAADRHPSSRACATPSLKGGTGRGRSPGSALPRGAALPACPRGGAGPARLSSGRRSRARPGRGPRTGVVLLWEFVRLLS